MNIISQSESTKNGEPKALKMDPAISALDVMSPARISITGVKTEVPSTFVHSPLLGLSDEGPDFSDEYGDAVDRCLDEIRYQEWEAAQ